MTVAPRRILNLLGRTTLMRLISERGLSPSRSNDERRETLARSCRGDVSGLIHQLTRQELLLVFQTHAFQVGGTTYRLPGASRRRLQELQELAAAACLGHFTPDFDATDDRGDVEDRVEEDDKEDQDDDETLEEDEEAEIEDAVGPESAVLGSLPLAHQLGIEDTGWSRPRQIARLLVLLGEDAPLRLRTSRFQSLVEQLEAAGIEACLADDTSATVLRRTDESPGIAQKLRLRRKDGATGRSSRTAVAPRRPAGQQIVEGGPPIIVQQGTRLSAPAVARPPDYSVALLRLQLLTAVPSAERRRSKAWPDGYLIAAVRGLGLGAQEIALLRAYAAGLCMGTHSPYDAIPALSQALTPSEWEELVADFVTLNPFQPEFVQTIVEQVAPMSARVVPKGRWSGVAPPDPAENRSVEAPAAPRTAQPRSQRPSRVPELGPSNQRDLGALSGMFDDE